MLSLPSSPAKPASSNGAVPKTGVVTFLLASRFDRSSAQFGALDVINLSQGQQHLRQAMALCLTQMQ